MANGGEGSFNDLTVKRTATADVNPGGTINYQMKVWNLGSDAALNFAVRDALPAGVTFVSAADAGIGPGAAFTCSEAGGVVNCIGRHDQQRRPGEKQRMTHRRDCARLVVKGRRTNDAIVDPDIIIPEGDEFNNTSTAPT